MKTTFRPKIKGSLYRKRFIYTLSVLLLLALGLSVFGSPILKLIEPVLASENAVTRGVKNFFVFLKDKDKLVSENIALRESLSEYDSLQISYRALLSSRDDLLARFGRAPQGEAVAAGVLSHPPETPYDILIIDAGQDAGVEVGDRVSLPDGGALGRINEVMTSMAKVELYSGSGVETAAYLERGGVPVTLVGRGGGSFRFTLPRDIAVEVGDRVFLTGIRSELLAVVRDVELEATDSEKRIIAGGVRNIGSIRFVRVH